MSFWNKPHGQTTYSKAIRTLSAAFYKYNSQSAGIKMTIICKFLFIFHLHNKKNLETTVNIYAFYVVYLVQRDHLILLAESIVVAFCSL